MYELINKISFQAVKLNGTFEPTHLNWLQLQNVVIILNYISFSIDYFIEF